MSERAFTKGGPERLDETMARHVDDGSHPGLVWMVARPGHLMMTDQLTPAQKAASDTGDVGTAWTVDRDETLVTILTTQKLWDSPDSPKVARDFRTAAYSALGD